MIEITTSLTGTCGTPTKLVTFNPKLGRDCGKFLSRRKESYFLRKRWRFVTSKMLTISFVEVVSMVLVCILTSSLALVDNNPQPLHMSNSFEDKIAVVLNLNARSVTQAAVSVAEDVVGRDHVFATASAEDNYRAGRTIISRGYGTVVPGGGDGTLCSVINAVVDAHRHRRTERKGRFNGGAQPKEKLPRFAFLPLGTGNGMAMLAGPRIRARTKTILVRKTLTRLKQIIDDSRKHAESSGERAGTYVPVLRCPMIEILTPEDIEIDAKRDGMTMSHLRHSQLCFFAGAGFDSLMLNDFNVVKRWSATKPGPIRRFFGSVAGYTVALLFRTLPQCLVWDKHKLLVRVTIPKSKPVVSDESSQNEDMKTYWMDPRRGDTAMEVLPLLDSARTEPTVDPAARKKIFPTRIDDDRELLFEGETGIIAAGTSPFYGGGLKLFPFARVQPHCLHLRLGRINPFVGFLNIPWIFRGTYRHYNMGCLDFLGKDFDIQLSEPYPFQYSGEATHGSISCFRLRIAREEIEFVDFLKPRLVLGYSD